MRLLEHTLADVHHKTFVLSDLGGESNLDAKFRWKINILSFLNYLEKRLVYSFNFYVILL